MSFVGTTLPYPTCTCEPVRLRGLQSPLQTDYSGGPLRLALGWGGGGRHEPGRLVPRQRARQGGPSPKRRTSLWPLTTVAGGLVPGEPAPPHAVGCTYIHRYGVGIIPVCTLVIACSRNRLVHTPRAAQDDVDGKNESYRVAAPVPEDLSILAREAAQSLHGTSSGNELYIVAELMEDPLRHLS